MDVTTPSDSKASDTTGHSGISRRGLLARSAAVGAAAVVAGPMAGLDSATAATRYNAVSYPQTPVPRAATRHLLSRFSYGVTPAMVKDANRAGSALKWFEQQLDPSAIKDDQAAAFASWWPSLDRDPANAWSLSKRGVLPGYRAMEDFAQWTLMRRVYSRRQVHEVMTEFWSNLLHVPARGASQFPWRFDYDSTIRAKALGRFDELLHAAITHPAMLIYLDGATSTAKAPNENLGREVLELHTVGRTGGYTEANVKDSARILTGYRVDLFNTWKAYYDTDSHATGAVKVMGFSTGNRSTDGRTVTRDYLTYLAHHPATAKRLARLLAVQFVSDDPPASLVNHLADVYLANGTAIKPVLRALVRSAAFNDAVGAKVRTPSQDVIATWRVLGVKATKPANDGYAACQILWSTAAAGQRIFGWPRPDGDPIVNNAWSGTSRILGSFAMHWSMSGGWYPSKGINYKTAAAWVPEFPIRFDELVDHLSRVLLARPSTDRLLKAACQMTAIAPGERITRDHALIRWKMPNVLSVLLDTPAHMSR